MKIIYKYQDTRDNEEDFALTPYLCAIKGKQYKKPFYGIGICWGWWANAVIVFT